MNIIMNKIHNLFYDTDKYMQNPINKSELYNVSYLTFRVHILKFRNESLYKLLTKTTDFYIDKIDFNNIPLMRYIIKIIYFSEMLNDENTGIDRLNIYLLVKQHKIKHLTLKNIMFMPLKRSIPLNMNYSIKTNIQEIVYKSLSIIETYIMYANYAKEYITNHIKLYLMSVPIKWLRLYKDKVYNILLKILSLIKISNVFIDYISPLFNNDEINILNFKNIYIKEQQQVFSSYNSTLCIKYIKNIYNLISHENNDLFSSSAVLEYACCILKNAIHWNDYSIKDIGIESIKQLDDIGIDAIDTLHKICYQCKLRPKEGSNNIFNYGNMATFIAAGLKLFPDYKLVICTTSDKYKLDHILSNVYNISIITITEHEIKKLINQFNQ